MSRIVTIQTQLQDSDLLTTSLEHLGCEVLREDGGIRMSGASAPVQLLARTPSGSLGFRKAQDGQYEIVGDDLVLERQQGLIQRLMQQYAYRKILKTAQAAGYTLVQEEARADRSIKLVVRKW